MLCLKKRVQHQQVWKLNQNIQSNSMSRLNHKMKKWKCWKMLQLWLKTLSTSVREMWAATSTVSFYWTDQSSECWFVTNEYRKICSLVSNMRKTWNQPAAAVCLLHRCICFKRWLVTCATSVLSGAPTIRPILSDSAYHPSLRYFLC